VIAIRRFKLTDSEVGTMEGVGHVIDAIEEFEPQITAVDETGMGGPVGDRLREQGYKVKKVNFAWKSSKPQRYGNKRAEMWGETRKWLESGQIPDDKRLRADLQGPKKKPDSKNVMFLESKKDMRARGLASPDAGDALALTFAFKVARRENQGYNGRAAGKRSEAYAPTPIGWMSI
jgi:phage terminase large subunit